ncbi:class I adenylate-forming enzyme family protein [Streptomyces spiramenti]|uniref:Acyl--CoA ligase n=1 Tax=Streptomyces spiramenti TaxID=2720606 RepID=A0ABX1ARX7_9ACTN|nr:class I adenylate-forming enzyme family protein [Streptomyces spiramenti]NJP67815.1 acyl--CoA ligase [Streptomyces spiramenti]
MTTTDRPASLFTDLVPRRVRRGWAARGLYRDLDLFTQFETRADLLGDTTAVVDAEGAVSFRELRDLALRLAGGLADLGVARGEVVGVQLPNSRLTCVVELAVAALGAVLMPFPPGRGGREAAALLAGAHAVCVVVPGEHRGHDYLTPALRLARTLPRLRTVVCAAPTDRAPELAALLRTAPLSAVRPDPDGPARIMVSSGSEAAPKMVAFSHNALVTGLGAVVAEVLVPGERPRSLWLVPLSAAFGSNATVGTLMVHGGTLVLQPHFDAADALRLVERHRPTHVFGVPTMLRLLAEEPAARGADTAGVRVVVAGGARLDAATARRATALFGCPVVSTYGSSDGVHCAMSDRGDGTGRDGSTRGGPGTDGGPGRADGGAPRRAGRPNPAVVDIRVVDEELDDVGPGRVGEIIARGPFTPLRYVGSDGLNARYRAPGGWVRTDDLGVLDAEGRLSVVDRRREIVLRGGANISPLEVEELLLRLPGIRDAACVGVPDEVMGERLCACVVPAPGTTPTLAELVALLRESSLEDRKLPERLVLLAALPYTPTGKVDRRRLRGIAAPSTGS